MIAQVERKPDITMPALAAVLESERGLKVDPSNLSKFLIAEGYSFKKTLLAREQERPDIGQERLEWRRPQQQQAAA